jgi:hypothetical protein
VAKADIKAGGAFVELFVKSGPLVKGLRQAQQQLQSFGMSVAKIGAGITAIGASIVGPLTAAVNHFASAGDVLDKTSQRVGVAASALAELGFAAEQAGSSLETVEKGLFGLSRSFFDARRGSKEAADAFKQIGLSAQALEGLAPEEQFQRVADGLATISDASVRGAVAQRLLGRSGRQLLPMFANLRELREEAKERGLVPSDEAVADAAKITDAFNRIRRTMLAVTFEIGAALAPVLLPALETIANIATTTIKWVRANQGIIRTIALIGVGLVAVGSVVTALGVGIMFVGAVLGGIATIVPVIGAAIGLVMTPVGAIVALVVALGASLAAAVALWVKFTASGQRAFRALTLMLRPFIETIKTAFGGIVDAISSGNIQLAWQILMTGMKLLFLQMIQFVTNKFLGLISLIANNPLVRQALGDGISSRIDAFVALSKVGQTTAVTALENELKRLRAEAAKGKAERGGRSPWAGLFGDEDELGGTPSRLRSAGTAGGALALQFGGRLTSDEVVGLLKEWRKDRRFHHGELMEELRRLRGLAHVGP